MFKILEQLHGTYFIYNLTYAIRSYTVPTSDISIPVANHVINKQMTNTVNNILLSIQISFCYQMQSGSKLRGKTTSYFLAFRTAD